ncbi:MAG TPA: class I SAM-dependent methyltransferase [Gemmatimonadaceae bacterium]|nr:class I SAM-dependent methyltransferase [Gemmatimonadaceae bacterium]
MLGKANPVYALGKELLHEVVDDVMPPPGAREAWVLDFHCGAGDDLARFLARGWNAVGCDGSAGMLRAAAARCARDLADGRLELWHGRAEELSPSSLDGRRFDLVFSTTGGFAYLDDRAFVQAHRVLAGMLTPDGVMVIAHLTPSCVAESLYHLLRLRPRRAVARWGGRVPVSIRGEQMLMRLRSPQRIHRLLSGVVRIVRLAPLLVVTPPFQSGFMPGPRTIATLRAIEHRMLRVAGLAAIADQAVCVAQPFRRP